MEMGDDSVDSDNDNANVEKPIVRKRQEIISTRVLEGQTLDDIKVDVHENPAAAYVHLLFYDQGGFPKDVADRDSETVSVVHFHSVLKARLGLELRQDQLQPLFAHICGADWEGMDRKDLTQNTEVSWKLFRDWWLQEGDRVEQDEIDVPVGPLLQSSQPPLTRTQKTDLPSVVREFRRLARTAGIFSACRQALATISSQEGVDSTRLLFDRLDTANLHEEMRLTSSNLTLICADLNIDTLSEDDIVLAVAEMDPTNRTFVTYKAFEEWWRYGLKHVSFDDHPSLALRNTLRVGGLLFSENATVSSALASAHNLVNSPVLLHGVDVALDKLAKNTDSHVGHVFDAAHQGMTTTDLVEDTMRGNSLGIFPPRSPVRKFCNSLTRSAPFELLVLLGILANLLVLVLYANVRRRDASSNFLDVLDFVNTVFGGIFTLEMVLRVIDQGFLLGSETYLMNWWNRFDFIIIMTMWITTILDLIVGWSGAHQLSLTVTALRSFRALRFFRGTRDIMTTLGEAANTLTLVTVIMLVVGVMFAIIGRELFGGALRRTCDHNVETENGTMSEHHRRLSSTSSHWYYTEPSEHCPTTLKCTDGCYEVVPFPGPKDREQHVDKYGFDNMAQSALTVFSITALDEWMHISHPLMVSNASTAWFVWPFFVLGVIFMGLLSVNLFLASITFSYLELKQNQRQEEAIEDAHRILVAILMNPTDGKAKLNAESTIESALGNGQGSDEEYEKDTSDFTPMRQWCYGITHGETGQKFNDFILLTVCVNTLCMAVESHEMNQTLYAVLYILEVIFTAIYVFEASLKIGANGFVPYIRVGMNKLDFFIVTTALFGYAFELFMLAQGLDSVNTDDAQAGTTLKLVRMARIFRAARAVRLGKLILRSDSVRTTLSQAFSSMHAVVSLIGMLAFVIFVLSILGVHLFWYCHETCHGRNCLYTPGNFDTLLSAFLSNYQLFSRDNWASIMFEYMECMHSHAASLYFTTTFTVLNFVLLPIFVSIFIDNFSLNEELKRKKQVEMYVKSTFKTSSGTIRLMDIKYISMGVNMLYKGSRMLKRTPVNLIAVDDAGAIENETTATRFELKDEEKEAAEALADSKSMGCFAQSHPVRVVTQKLGNAFIWQNFVILMIAASGVAMALEGPSRRDSHDSHGDDKADLMHLLDMAEYIFYTVFLVECIAKIVADGFYETPNAYLGNVSNVFDFLVVCVTTIDMMLRILQVDAAWVQAIRLLRTLRLVRLLEHIDGMAVMAQAIVKCFPSVAAIMALLMGNIVMFAIIGMNLFMGELWSCNGDISLSKVACEAGGYPWVNSFFSFDDFWESLAVLTIVSTRQGWYLIFYQVVDSTPYEQAPEVDASVYTSSIFFVIFILINGFMLEELFVGMLVEVFSQSSGTVLLTASQKKWRYVEMFIFHLQKASRPAPSKPLARKCYDLISKPEWKIGISSLAVGAVLSLMVNSAVYEVDDSPAFDWINDFVLLLMTVHVVMRTLAYGGLRHVKESWYDHVLVILLWIVSIAAHLQHFEAIDGHNWGWLQSLQSLRALWLVEALNASAQMRKLVHTIKMSLPQALNIFTLMALVFFVFGIMFMKLYGDIDVDHPTMPLKALGHGTNFGDIFHSMQLLFQITTGHPLPKLVEDIQSSPSAISFVPLLFVFFVATNFVFLNLFVALLLENFEYIWEVCIQHCGSPYHRAYTDKSLAGRVCHRRG
jgi:hypothetical protein